MSDVITNITAEVEVKQYTLVGDDIYVKRYTNENIPTWYRNLVSDIIAADNTVLDQASAIAYLESLAPGYNISITSLQNKDLQIDTSIESLVTKDGDKTAAIAQLNITKVDATSAAAIAQNTIGTYFAGSESAAWFNSKVSTYASNIAANAASITTLSASLNGQEVRIDAVDEVNIAQDTAIGVLNTSTENALLALTDLEEARDGNVVVYYLTTTGAATGMTYGDYLVDTDSLSGSSYTVYRYENATGGSSGVLAWYVNAGETAKALSSGYYSQVLAGTAQSTADGKVKTWYQVSAPTLAAGDVGDIWVDTDNGNKLQVWSGSAWQDQTSAQGSQAYTWSATSSKLITSPDGSITGWSFGDGTGIKSYFQINATNFKISDGTTGYTPFSIVGSNISFNGVVDFTNTNTYGTTTIDGGKITTGSITAGQIAANSITADKIQAVNINGYMIEGAIIKGASIEGSVIKSSWIDYTSTGDLTNWQYYTPATVPTAYAANFAHNNEGVLIVDSQGYVRLAGSTKVYSLTSGLNDGIASYDAYTINTIRRTVSQYPRLTATSVGYIMQVTCELGAYAYYGPVAMTVAGIPFSMRVRGISGVGFLTLEANITINGVESSYSTTNAKFNVVLNIAGISFLLTSSGTTAYISININNNSLITGFVVGSSYLIGNFSATSGSADGRPSYYVTQ